MWSGSRGRVESKPAGWLRCMVVGTLRCSTYCSCGDGHITVAVLDTWPASCQLFLRPIPNIF